MIQPLLHQALVAAAPFEGIPASEIYWLIPPPGRTPASCILYRKAGIGFREGGGLSELPHRAPVNYQISIGSRESIAHANLAAVAIRDVLEGIRPAWGAGVVDDCILTNELDSDDEAGLLAGYFTVVQSFQITLMEV